MPTEFRIELTPSAKAVISHIQTFPRRMQIGLIRALNQQNELTASRTIETKLNFSHELKGKLQWLRRRTGKLQKSIRRGGEDNISEAAHAEGDSIVSAIGSNVRYAAIHEFGWTGVVAPHIRRRFKKTTILGDFAPLGRGLRGLTGVTRRKSVRVKARGGDVFVGQSKIKTIPARPFLATTLQEREPEYSAALSRAIETEWEMM